MEREVYPNCPAQADSTKAWTTRVQARAMLRRLYPPPPKPRMRPAANALRDGAEPGRGMGMRFLRQRQVGDRVPAEAVGAALEDDELGRVALEMGLDRRPGGEKFGVAGARRQGQVQLGPVAAPVPVSDSAPVPGYR